MTLAHRLYTVGAIRRIEQSALRTLPPFTLMQRAGAASAALASELLQDLDAPKILIIAGPGNNGGDALEAAHLLSKTGDVTVLLTTAPGNLPTDAQTAWRHAQDSHVHWLTQDNQDQLKQTSWDLVIDGLFGIGLMRAVTGNNAQLIRTINALHARYVLALDVPSGLDADTGNIVGLTSGCAIQATHTLTFIGNKAGLHTGDGPDHAGIVHVADLSLDPALLHTTRMQCTRIADFDNMLRARRQNTHKGSYGNAVIIGGAAGMLGAAILSARTAAKLGTGRVFLAMLDPHFSLDLLQPEIMCRAIDNMPSDAKTLVVGPGLGTARAAHDVLAKALQTNAALVLDADALNLLAMEMSLQKKLQGTRRPLILTPHPLEAARLLDCDTAAVQSDRVAAARTLASRLHAIVILKGAGSIIAKPDGEIMINPTGNPGLATAGAGDVLAGVCGALLAQDWPAWEAALAATWMHGRAADDLVEQGIGPIGLTASELIPAIRSTLNQLVNTHQPRQI
ncbi:MAG: NAD(P)H-hydrate dehydratase [Oxalicibacterium faecigallinarum]|uniref:NAD(P)H-hydrate dehydratase n=1 Tax=Oxalicibacterium faecigallinarum TaxID=573741 RepID=UPI002808D418|nr:NAD(P)H-hydrate dehydratase [Oxalicibacterium faecigallinarum]MDQ7968814.1 NAD(P)H-hydrate dehydratase [Oxalicibacterium faecigallinarum]